MTTDKYRIYSRVYDHPGYEGRRYWYLDDPYGYLIGGPYLHWAGARHAFRHYTRGTP